MNRPCPAQVFWNRGTYADRTRTADKYEAYEAPPTNGNELMRMAPYVDACAAMSAGRYDDGKARYLQHGVGERPRPRRGDTALGPFVHGPCLSSPLRRDVETLDASLLAKLGAAAGFREHMKTKLYVGPRGAVSRCHCDGYDGLVVQVAGRKRVVLFDPLQARHLYVYPQHHGLELRPRVHVDAPDFRRFPRYRGAVASSAVLEPGETLYIPHHWWHHIECLSECTVSVNLWLSTGGDTVDATGSYATLFRSLRKPLGPGWTYELARHVELAVAESLPGGGGDVPAFLDHCAAELRGEDGGRDSAPPLWHALRCALLARLADFLGHRSLPNFFDDLLDPARFRGIPRVEPEMAFGDESDDPAVARGGPVFAPLP